MNGRRLSILVGILAAFSSVLGGAEEKREVPKEEAPLPDIRLTGDEVTPEAIVKLADREWGTVTLGGARFNGAIIERLRHVPSIRTL